MNTRTRKMIGHGAIVSFFGLFAGIGLIAALVGGLELLPGMMIEMELPADSRAWARAHSGGIMNGLLVFAGAFVIHAMSLPESTAARLYWMFVGTGYANTIFYWASLFAPSRSLTFSDNRLGESNLAGLIGLVPALIFAFITMIAMVIIARAAFAATAEEA